MYVFTQPIRQEQDGKQGQFLKQCTTGFKSEFFLLLDRLPNQG